MEHNKKVENSEREKLELVLLEVLEEQKETNKTNVNVVNTVNHLSGKMSKFEEKLQNFQIASPTVNTKEIQDIVSKGMLSTSMLVERQMKNSSRKFQILLFPPQDAKLFYRVVFGRWFLYTVIALAILKVYDWAIHQSDNNARVQMETERAMNDKFIKAWNYLYDQGNKGLRRQMDTALIKFAIEESINY